MRYRFSLLLVLFVGFVPILHSQSGSSPADLSGIVISYWDKPWGVRMNVPGFTVKANGYQPDGRRYVMASDETGLMNISVILEEFPSKGPLQSCKEAYNQRLKMSLENFVTESVTGMQKKNAKIWERDDRTYLEYNIPTVKSSGKTVPLNQQNKFVCFAHDGVFIDVHVSKVNFNPSEEKLIEPVLDAISVADGVTKTVMDYWVVGTLFYNNNDFKRAIPPYAQALVMEQSERELDKGSWCVLVDNLGMAYGVTGDLETARKTFEYGIQNDPDYPMFYYEVADYYAEKGDVKNAIEYLKKAYERRANVMPGEKFPDPRSDDSFKKMLKNPDFRNFVDSLPVELQRRP